MVHRIVVCLTVALCLVGNSTAAAQKVSPPRKIKNVDPVYPPSAQQARVHGDVVIEATIGADGKVSQAKVVQSTPLLDEAALAAVRQWEYEPTIVNGVAVPVVATVTVHFSLANPAPPAPSSPAPPVLDRNGDDWTIDGTPLLDDDLRFWLRYVMRTEPQKTLYVHVAPNGTVSDLVQLLADATVAGVERLHLFVGDATRAQAVRVWLEPVTQKPTTVALPVSDAGSQVAGGGVPVTLSRAGAVTSAKTSVERAPAGAVVHLRVDRSRRISDVWELMKIGSARTVDGVAIAVQLPPGAVAAVNAPVSSQQQNELEKMSAEFSAMMRSDKTLDEVVAMSVPILEKFVTRNPNVLDAQFKLATAYEGRTTASNASPDAKRRDWENAVHHYAITSARHENEDARFISTWKIAQLYGPDRLNDKTKAQRYAQQLVDEHATHPESHILLAQMLHDTGDIGGAVNVLRDGRAAAPMNLTALIVSLQYLAEQVQGNRNLPRDRARALLEEANSVTDAILAHPDTDDSLYRSASLGKSMVLDLQAERVADTPQQRVALLVEADRWGSHLDERKKGSPPPARKLSATETAALECEALGRWSSRLGDAQPLPAAMASVQKYVAERPGCYATHRQMAELHTRAAHDSSDAAARSTALDRAIAEHEQVIDLAPTTMDRSAAFSQVIELSGPSELNRPGRAEAAARVFIKREPDDPMGYTALATIQFRSGRTGDGEKTLRTARTAVKSTVGSRTIMAADLLRTLDRETDFPAPAARRLFGEATTLMTEAEKLTGGKDDLLVLSTRIRWLNLSADRFEQDPGRAAAQREQAKQLMERMKQIR